MQQMITLHEYKKEYLPFEFIDDDWNLVVNDLNKFFKLEHIKQKKLLRVEAKSYVGICKIGDKTIIINPKIGLINFWKILKHINSPIINFFEPLVKHQAISSSIDYFTIFLSNFLDMIDNLCKTNYRKKYQKKIDKRINIKGKILFKKQLEKNPYLFNKIYCSFDVFSFNNIFNQIIKYSLFLCSKITNILNPNIIRKFKRVYHYFDRVSLKKITNQVFSRFNYDSNTKKYKKIHQICRLIINNLKFYNKKGKEIFFTFLFDINKIFEQYVQNIVKKFSQFQVETQRTGEYLDLENSHPIYPDIKLIDKNDTVVHVIDIKYKEKIAREDFWQVLAYCGHFNIISASLIYIETPESKITSLTVPMFSNDVKINILRFDITNFDEHYLKSFVSTIEKNF